MVSEPQSALNERLRIGIIAPPWVAVPPPGYGGTEMMIDILARGLSNAGHDVELFATGDSTCPVPTQWLHDRALGTNGTLTDELGHVQAAYSALAHCDVIHDHTLIGPVWAHLAHPEHNVVTTVHGSFTPAMSELYAQIAHWAAVVAISHHQRSTAPGIDMRAVIHHGLDPERYPIGTGDGGYLAFLGRMNPDKGVHHAIRASRAAGKRLLIAAKMWEPAEFDYFDHEVRPLLDDDAEYIGEVTGADKIEFLGRAEALINPIQWPEPFGLVMIEALACGTPVIAFRSGASPEIVDHGTTGYLCDDFESMTHSIARLTEIARHDCRARCMDRFSTPRMAADYVAAFRAMLAAPCEGHGCQR